MIDVSADGDPREAEAEHVSVVHKRWVTGGWSSLRRWILITRNLVAAWRDGFW